jgi:DNA repair protein RadD
MDLRPYQVESIERLRQGIRDGHRSQLLCAPTGAGKTICAAFLMAEADRKLSHTAFMVDRVNLVDQTSAVLDKYGVAHGVIQAGHWRWRPYERVQVCSAQTLEKRGFLPQTKLLIVDEAHCIRKQTAEFIKSREDIRVIGLSATPFTNGLSALYTNLVNVTTTDKLVADGHLVPLTMYAAKAVDMTGARVVAGEWAESEIEERGLKIIGDIVGEWTDKTLKHFGGPVKTIVFSATVAHGEELCRQFNAAGFNFQQISYKDANEERRRELIEEFRKPDSTITGLVACEIFTRGFDVPDIMCGIAARPYRKSFSSHIQQLGRVMRPHPGKESALWLCHSSNLLRFREDTFDLFANGVGELDDGARDNKVRKEPTPKEKERYACSCGYLMPPAAPRCPACGKERSRLSLVENVDGEMIALTKAEAEVPVYLRDRDAVWRQLCGLALERKQGDVDAAERFAKANYRNLFGAWPRYAMRNITPEEPSLQLRNKVKQLLIRYFKSKASHRASA